MTKNLPAYLFLVILSSFLALPAYGQLIYDNGVTPNTGFASQLDTLYPFNAQVADDFSLATGNGLNYSVTGMHFRGVFFNTSNGVPNPLDFNILFYDDAGGVPTGGPGDPSATAIASYSLSNVLGTDLGGNTFDYTVDWSATPFELAPDTTYWVAVQSVFNFPPQWGWMVDNSGGNAVQGFPLLGINYWTDISAEADFQLFGQQFRGGVIPEPTTLMIWGFGIACVGFVGRRRRR